MRTDGTVDSGRGNDSGKRNLSTADLAEAARRSTEMPPPEVGPDDEDAADADLEGSLGGGALTAGDRRRVQASERATPTSASTGAAIPVPASITAEKLEPLFSTDLAERFRAQWSAVQSGFVDDPRRAARQGDELVAQVMKSLAESFAAERTHLESQLGETGEGATEALRLSLRRYRSFFDRLLSL
ncbi:MAG TPA: hypothetical protein VGM84_10510 [Steroidobacteraceae bacterium]|jgi:hypothetical protein